MKVKVKFRKSTVPGQAGTIYYQLSHLGRVRQMTSGIHLLPEQWEATKQGRISPVSDADPTVSFGQHRINNDLLFLNRMIRDLNDTGRAYTIDEVMCRLVDQKRYVTVLAFIREQVTRLTKIGRLGTARNYTRTLTSFSTFLRNTDLPFSALTERLIEEYAVYLKQRQVVRNTVSFYMRVLRSIYNKAVREQLVEQCFPFKNVYTGVDRTRKRAVDEQVICQLSHLELQHSSALSLARDLFIFSYCTRGMAFIDMAYLQKRNISAGMIYYIRRKTGQQLCIRLEPCMQTIIKRYENQTRNTSYIFPVLKTEEDTKAYLQYQTALSYYNRLLKKLMSLLKINSNLSSYTSRHSWATVARKYNIPLSVISAGMGHASERTTQIYLTTLENSVIDSANQRIVDSINCIL